MRAQEFITENSGKYKFLRPGELRGSYTDSQLRALGFRQSQSGSWYIALDKWNELVRTKQISESESLVEKRKRNKRKSKTRRIAYGGWIYGYPAASGESGEGGGDGGVAEEKNNDTAISLSRLGKFHKGLDPLAEFVPERATARYALHPEKWESTFFSLTNKDPRKLKYFGPKKIEILPGTLVGDMAIANRFYRAETPEEKQKYAEEYRQSLKAYPVDVSQYRMPELLIPQQGLSENFADGRNPQDKGDSRRYNVPTKGKISTLRKIAKQGGRRGQLAHWMANMRSGKQKAKK
jgi:hypothetical protein